MSLRINYNDDVTNKIVLTLQEGTDTVLPYNATYSMSFIFTDTEYSGIITDTSANPSDFNTFYITTSLIDGDFPINLQGWCDFNVSYEEVVIETGKCYVADSIEVENRPDNTYAYERVVNKYVYNRNYVLPTDDSLYNTTEDELYIIANGMYVVVL
jgi:hypothetical protein